MRVPAAGSERWTTALRLVRNRLVAAVDGKRGVTGVWWGCPCCCSLSVCKCKDRDYFSRHQTEQDKQDMGGRLLPFTDSLTRRDT